MTTDPIPQTIYDPEDLVWLSHSLSMHGLMKPNIALGTLHKHATDLEALPENGVLSEDTPVETLITADGYLRCLGAYNVDVRDDLLIRSGHLTLVTLGGLLALLSPQEGDLAVLSHAQRRAGAESWVVDLAHRNASETPAGQLQEHLSLIETIRSQLAKVERPKPRLWRVADIPREALDVLQAEVSALYKAKGADAAHAHVSAAMNAPDAGALGQFLKDRAARRA